MTVSMKYISLPSGAQEHDLTQMADHKKISSGRSSYCQKEPIQQFSNAPSQYQFFASIILSAPLYHLRQTDRTVITHPTTPPHARLKPRESQSGNPHRRFPLRDSTPVIRTRRGEAWRIVASSLPPLSPHRVLGEGGLGSAVMNENGNGQFNLGSSLMTGGMARIMPREFWRVCMRMRIGGVFRR